MSSHVLSSIAARKGSIQSRLDFSGEFMRELPVLGRTDRVFLGLLPIPECLYRHVIVFAGAAKLFIPAIESADFQLTAGKHFIYGRQTRQKSHSVAPRQQPEHSVMGSA